MRCFLEQAAPPHDFTELVAPLTRCICQAAEAAQISFNKLSAVAETEPKTNHIFDDQTPFRFAELIKAWSDLRASSDALGWFFFVGVLRLSIPQTYGTSM